MRRARSVFIPRYRIDILHPVDIAEEVAIGYGIDSIEAEYPPSKRPGAFDPSEKLLDGSRRPGSESGIIELMTHELVSEADPSMDKFSDARPRPG